MHSFLFEEEKSFHIIEFFGKTADWESWSNKFLSHVKHRKYKILLVSSGSMVEVDKVPIQHEYENALECDIDIDKKFIKLVGLNELAYDDIILSINTYSSVRKVAFGIVRNVKSVEFPKGNCKIAWDRVINKYVPHTASSLLKLKNNFHNHNFESIEKDPDKWISNMEGRYERINSIIRKVLVKSPL